MKIIKTKCPNCKSTVEVNSKLNKFTCNYCGATTILNNEETIVDHVSSDLKDKLIVSLKDYHKSGDYKSCYHLSKKLMEAYPTNKIVKTCYHDGTINYTKKLINDKEYIEALNCLEMAYDIFPKDKDLNELYKKCYLECYKGFNNSYFHKERSESNEYPNIFTLSSSYKIYKAFPKDSDIKESYEKIKNEFIKYLKASIKEGKKEFNYNCKNYKEFSKAKNDEYYNRFEYPGEVLKEIGNKVFPEDESVKELCLKYEETITNFFTNAEWIEPPKPKFKDILKKIIIPSIICVILLVIIYLLLNMK